MNLDYGEEKTYTTLESGAQHFQYTPVGQEWIIRKQKDDKELIRFAGQQKHTICNIFLPPKPKPSSTYGGYGSNYGSSAYGRVDKSQSKDPNSISMTFENRTNAGITVSKFDPMDNREEPLTEVKKGTTYKYDKQDKQNQKDKAGDQLIVRLKDEQTEQTEQTELMRQICQNFSTSYKVEMPKSQESLYSKSGEPPLQEEETSMCFLNSTKAEVVINWINFQEEEYEYVQSSNTYNYSNSYNYGGYNNYNTKAKPTKKFKGYKQETYAILKQGEQHFQHSAIGYQWVAKTKDGDKELMRCVAQQQHADYNVLPESQKFDEYGNLPTTTTYGGYGGYSSYQSKKKEEPKITFKNQTEESVIITKFDPKSEGPENIATILPGKEYQTKVGLGDQLIVTKESDGAELMRQIGLSTSQAFNIVKPKSVHESAKFDRFKKCEAHGLQGCDHDNEHSQALKKQTLQYMKKGGRHDEDSDDISERSQDFDSDQPEPKKQEEGPKFYNEDTFLTFINQTGQTIEVNWLSPSQREHTYDTVSEIEKQQSSQLTTHPTIFNAPWISIAKGQTHIQQTPVGHQWIVRLQQDGTELMRESGQARSMAFNVLLPNTQFDKYGNIEQINDHTGGQDQLEQQQQQSSSLTFVNKTNETILVNFLHPETLEEQQFTELKQGKEHVQETSVGNQWVIRNSKDRKEIRRYVCQQKPMIYVIQIPKIEAEIGDKYGGKTHLPDQGNGTSMTFINHTSDTVLINWMKPEKEDDLGQPIYSSSSHTSGYYGGWGNSRKTVTGYEKVNKEITYATLKPGEQYLQNTSIGSQWIARNGAVNYKKPQESEIMRCIAHQSDSIHNIFRPEPSKEASKHGSQSTTPSYKTDEYGRRIKDAYGNYVKEEKHAYKSETSVTFVNRTSEMIEVNQFHPEATREDQKETTQAILKPDHYQELPSKVGDQWIVRLQRDKSEIMREACQKEAKTYNIILDRIKFSKFIEHGGLIQKDEGVAVFKNGKYGKYEPYAPKQQEAEMTAWRIRALFYSYWFIVDYSLHKEKATNTQTSLTFINNTSESILINYLDRYREDNGDKNTYARFGNQNSYQQPANKGEQTNATVGAGQQHFQKTTIGLQWIVRRESDRTELLRVVGQQEPTSHNVFMPKPTSYEIDDEGNYQPVYSKQEKQYDENGSIREVPDEEKMTLLNFVNDTPDTILINWLNAAAKREETYAKIEPGIQILQKTQIGDEWIIRQQRDGRELMRQVGQEQPITHSVVPKQPYQQVDYRGNMFDLTSVKTSLTFINQTNQQVLINFVDPKNPEETYASIRPGGQHFQSSMVGTQWIARNQIDGNEIMRYVGQYQPKTYNILPLSSNFDSYGNMELKPNNKQYEYNKPFAYEYDKYGNKIQIGGQAQSSSITFVNLTDENIIINWVNPNWLTAEDQEQMHAKVKSGKECFAHTQVGHQWVVRLQASGSELMRQIGQKEHQICQVVKLTQSAQPNTFDRYESKNSAPHVKYPHNNAITRTQYGSSYTDTGKFSKDNLPIAEYDDDPARKQFLQQKGILRHDHGDRKLTLEEMQRQYQPPPPHTEDPNSLEPTNYNYEHSQLGLAHRNMPPVDEEFDQPSIKIKNIDQPYDVADRFMEGAKDERARLNPNNPFQVQKIREQNLITPPLQSTLNPYEQFDNPYNQIGYNTYQPKFVGPHLGSAEKMKFQKTFMCNNLSCTFEDWEKENFADDRSDLDDEDAVDYGEYYDEMPNSNEPDLDSLGIDESDPRFRSGIRDMFYSKQEERQSVQHAILKAIRYQIYKQSGHMILYHQGSIENLLQPYNVKSFLVEPGHDAFEDIKGNLGNADSSSFGGKCTEVAAKMRAIVQEIKTERQYNLGPSINSIMQQVDMYEKLSGEYSQGVIISFQCDKVFEGEEYEGRDKRHCVVMTGRPKRIAFNDSNPHPTNSIYNDDQERWWYPCANSWGSLHENILVPAYGAIIQASVVQVSDLVKLEGYGPADDESFSKRKISIIREGMYQRGWDEEYMCYSYPSHKLSKDDPKFYDKIKDMCARKVSGFGGA